MRKKLVPVFVLLLVLLLVLGLPKNRYRPRQYRATAKWLGNENYSNSPKFGPLIKRSEAVSLAN